VNRSSERNALNKIRRAYRRWVFRAKLSRARLIYAAGIGLIVGGGMAVFLPFVHQPPLLLGFGSGVAAFLIMLFVD
jgi:hypothetical protein